MEPIIRPQHAHEIRLLSKEDTKSVWALVRECSQWLSTQGLHHWSEYYTETIVAQKILASPVYGTYEGQSLVGIVSVSPRVPDYYLPLMQQAGFSHFQKGYMSMLATSPGYQKRGIATELTQHAEFITRNRGLRGIQIDVLSAYTLLNNFYLKRGYQLLFTAHDGDQQMNFYEKKLS